jgi:hypothetical protein
MSWFHFFFLSISLNLGDHKITSVYNVSSKFDEKYVAVLYSLQLLEVEGLGLRSLADHAGYVRAMRYQFY